MEFTKSKFGILLVLVLMLASVVSPVNAQAQKTDVCHFDADSGTYHLINVSNNAVEAHVNHGDGFPGGAVPGMDGYVFGGDCSPQPVGNPYAKAGCFEARLHGYYFITDGTSPQMLVHPVLSYTDSNCTVLSGISDDSVDAWIWEGNYDDAWVVCQSIGGNLLFQQTEPNLYACWF